MRRCEHERRYLPKRWRTSGITRHEVAGPSAAVCAISIRLPNWFCSRRCTAPLCMSPGEKDRAKFAWTSWVASYMAPAMAADEVLTAISFPLWQERCGEAFLEFARRRGDFALAAVAVRVALVDGRISRIALALGGLAIAPIRLSQAEAALIGAIPDKAAADLLAAEVKTLDVMGDAHVSSSYRKSLAETLDAARICPRGGKGLRIKPCPRLERSP